MSAMNQIPVRAYGVAVVVVREGGDEHRFLLLRRTRKPVGAWTYVAGALEAGEKAYDAAVREIREETALDVRVLYSADLCEQFYEIGNDSIWIAPVFVAFVGGESRVVTNEEHSEYRWCTITEGVALLTFPGAGQILQTVDSHFVAREPNPFLRIAC